MKLQDLVGLLTLRQHAQNLMGGLRGDLKLNKETKDKLYNNIKKIDQLFLDQLSDVVTKAEVDAVTSSEDLDDEVYEKMFENNTGVAQKDPAIKVKTMSNVEGKKSGFVKFGVTEDAVLESPLKNDETSKENETLFKEELAKLSDEIDSVFNDTTECTKEEFTKKISGFFGAKGKVAELNTLLKNMSTENIFTAAKQLNELKTSFEKRKKQKLESYKNK